MATILILNADARERHVLAARLAQDLGHEILMAGDGQTGLRLFQRTMPQLLITTIFMPQKDGLETIREVRRTAPTVKILAMSPPHPLGGDVLRVAHLLGAHATMVMPCSHARVRQVVQRLLGPTPVAERHGDVDAVTDLMDPGLAPYRHTTGNAQNQLPGRHVTVPARRGSSHWPLTPAFNASGPYPMEERS